MILGVLGANALRALAYPLGVSVVNRNGLRRRAAIVLSLPLLERGELILDRAQGER